MNNPWLRLLWALALVLLCALPVLLPAHAADGAGAMPFDYRLRARELAEGVYVVEGASADFAPVNGCNIINTGFIVTGAGVVVINTGPSRRYGEQLRALIARTTREPVLKVVHLNLHPDYFLGNQAFEDVPRLATPLIRAGMARDAGAYEDNLYRLCGDWMKGTEHVLPSADAVPGVERIGRHELETVEMRGHTASDLVLVDRTRGVVFAGGLVFSRRVPTTPHADLPAWRDSLRRLSAFAQPIWVPSHGTVDGSREAIAGTDRYLAWIDGAFTAAARRGDEMNEVLRLPVPPEFRAWAAFETEYVRNVANLYPRYERAALEPATPLSTPSDSSVLFRKFVPKIRSMDSGPGQGANRSDTHRYREDCNAALGLKTRSYWHELAEQDTSPSSDLTRLSFSREH